MTFATQFISAIALLLIATIFALKKHPKSSLIRGILTLEIMTLLISASFFFFGSKPELMEEQRKAYDAKINELSLNLIKTQDQLKKVLEENTALKKKLIVAKSMIPKKPKNLQEYMLETKARLDKVNKQLKVLKELKEKKEKTDALKKKTTLPEKKDEKPARN